MFHLKQQIDGIHTSFEGFNGIKPILLLPFLTLLRDTIDTLGTSEAASVRVITNLLDVDAIYVWNEQFPLVEYDFDGGAA